MAQGGEAVFSLQPSEMVKWLEAKLDEASIVLKPKQRQALEGLNSGEELLLILETTSELTYMGFTLSERAAIKRIVHSLQQCYVVRATYFGAKQRKGIRASVFKNAQAHNAYYYPVQSKSIWYDDGDDLKITLLFEEKQHAMKFQDFLTMWYIENPMVVKSRDVSVEEELKVMYVEKCKLCRVFLSHCDPDGSDSPIQDLGEFLGHPSASSDVSDISSSDPMVQFQSIEKPELFRKCKPYKLHLKSQAIFPNLATVESNMLVGSWTPFHQFFHGIETEDDLPQLAIKPLTEGEFEAVMVGEPPQKRQKVDLSLEFYDADAAEIMAENLKVGSEKLSHTVWKTSVLVPNAEIFCDCLKWKYEQTTTLWQDNDENIVGLIARSAYTNKMS